MSAFVVISMTTVPCRNGTLGATIRSLQEQSLKPDQIRLYLTPGCESVPSVNCVWTSDLGPITKLSAVRECELSSDAIIVTADDDQIYAPNWLSTLVEGAKQYPNEAVGLSGWNVSHFLRDPVRGTYEWLNGPGPCDVLEGFAGTAYRKSFFADDVWSIPATCRFVDDVWISGYLFRRGIGRRVVGKKLQQSTAHDQQGLHTRSDFVELNRKASVLMFKQATAKLSICIPSLTSRSALLDRLLACLRSQPRSSEVEIISDVDEGQRTTGAKRNQLVARSCGDYVVHIDDDDLVAPNYIPAILEAIERHPGVDAVVLRGRRRSTTGEIAVFDYGVNHVEGRTVDSVLWRKISHLCPVRRDLAARVFYPDLTLGEDLQWAETISPFINTFARAGGSSEVLYYYEFCQKDHQTIFTPQYRDASGPGSTRSITRPYRRFLESFIKDHRLKTILDLGCGDMEVMSRVDLRKAKYLGVDVISERVARNAKKHPDLKFKRGDARTFSVDGFDLVIIKDVLQHWSNDEVKVWIDRFLASSAKMALVTNCNYGPTVNTNIPTGTWRALDLTKPPFSVGSVVFRWSMPRGPFIDDKDVVLIKR